MAAYPLKLDCEPYPIQISNRVYLHIFKDGRYFYSFHPSIEDTRKLEVISGIRRRYV